MQALIDRQAALEVALDAERAARAAEDTARPQASASEAYRDRPSLRATIDTRLLGKPEKFMGEDSKWKYWEFVTRAYLVAAIEGIEAAMTTTETQISQLVQNVHLNPEERAASSQIYFALIMLCGGRALDRVPGAGNGEGSHAWRELHLYWQPKTSTRFVGLLTEIICFKMGGCAGDLLGNLETWKRQLRDFEKQTQFVLPDFMKIGLLLVNLQEDALKEHLVMHSARLNSFDLLEQELRDVATNRRRFATGGDSSAPMLVDYLRED